MKNLAMKVHQFFFVTSIAFVRKSNICCNRLSDFGTLNSAVGGDHEAQLDA
jgi:hypothetical protein